MELTKRHTIATALVAAILIPYAGYTIAGEMPLIQDARGMGATGLVLGAIAYAVLGVTSFGPRWFAVGAAVLAAGLGITAAVLETGTASSVFLAAFVVVVVAMWGVAMARTTGVAMGRIGGRGLTPRHS